MTDESEPEASLCVFPCDACPHIKISEEEQIIDIQQIPYNENTEQAREIKIVYSIINLSECPYKYVKIEGKFYRRIVDTKDNCAFFDRLSQYCYDCGIKNGVGLNHHIGCDCEICPVENCGRQFISCPSHATAKDLRFYRELPKYARPKLNKSDSKKLLRKFIEK